MRAICKVFSVMLILPALALLPGCSKTPSGSISGKVMYKDAPVTGGTLAFHPKNGGPGYSVQIRPDGTFSQSGVTTLGEVTVTVKTDHLKGGPGKGDPTDPNFVKEQSKDKQKTDAMPADLTGKGKGGGPPMDASAGMKKGGASPVYVPIPEKYGDPKKSDLTWEIKQGTNPEKTFELK